MKQTRKKYDAKFKAKVMSCIVDDDNHEKYWTEVEANKYSNEYFRENKIIF